MSVESETLESLRERLTRSEARVTALAATSRAFALAVDRRERLLEGIARAAADIVGDGCLVNLVSADGRVLAPAATAHRDRAREMDYIAYTRALPPVALDASHAIAARVARTGQAQLVPHVRPEDLAAQLEPALRPVVERLSPHSFVVVPIRAHGEILGTLSALRSTGALAYTTDDQALLEDIADRAGLAISNARAYEALERRVDERTHELRAANDDLRAFSYSVAHDLRAPLRAILGHAHFLREDLGEKLDADSEQNLVSIEASARRMAQLIDDLLAFARVSQATVNRARIDVSGVAREVLARLRAAEPARDVEVSIEDGLVADADPALLEVVLTNLLGNAWKFTSKLPHATIRLERSGGAFVVRDDGSGFDASTATQLFEPFRRMHTLAEFEGTGIGLALVKRIVGRHEGRVWAEAATGRGASFFFTLGPEA